MEIDTVILDLVARAFGRKAVCDDHVRKVLQQTPFVFDGFGSIARPASEALANLGADKFFLTDPKEYVAASVHSQCTAEEMGRRKVDVGAERLREAGASAIAFARDIASIPEGVISQNSIVITTVDNRRADIISNRRVGRMGARIIKANVAPELGVASVRCYDQCHKSALCVECQFADHHYAAQRHPRSCDGTINFGAGGKRTNSPRWLSQVAAQLVVFTAMDLAAGGSAADDWFGHERQYCHTTGVVTTSRLEPNLNCRRDHEDRWQNLVRLEEDETTISLRELFWAAATDVDDRAKIRFCQHVALRGRCPKCRTDVAMVRWITDSQRPIGPCQNCGAALLPVPFCVLSETSIEPLLAIFDQRLCDWGVERFAVIEIARGQRRVSFVVGGL